ncbi:MAG: ATP-dependent 6-phosphofructokinase [Pseudomonadota bacterium]|uniref:ATP-dependent 6-phosphofructokinase n=1 Tax=Candidatus Desulfatibia profunda TaxID=2841695 RepID=A0A8J6TL37_9BACT|nr:ATP-dependent 6-phosphofructokinase [Candidatus Desulfatibia profunda]MBL7179248.1 ATP-dependent 6-phosphofructokinase [Desulfobacterales bacterium]
MNYQDIETRVPNLGEAKIPSPIQRGERGAYSRSFVDDSERILIDVHLDNLIMLAKEGKDFPSFELAGPRRKIYFDPSKLRCALVTCGGLCPGLNDIIRAIVLELFYGYSVNNILGFRYGLQGFIPKYGHDVFELKPETVGNILEMGGSILGSSRGPQPIDEIVDTLERMNIGILFLIGGDGTLMAATKIAAAITARSLKISVIGIPKTIDNDIYLVSRSFGFDTAVDVATQAIKGAHNEAEAYPNGIGLIKLMGRHSGFIATTAALAQQEANFVLIPEVDFDLEGPKGFLVALEKRLKLRGHAVIVVAEGTGQKFFEDHAVARDESGNIRLKDIGFFLKDTITSYFMSKNTEVSLKYIDPSYTIRSLPANASDAVFCSFLGRDAVHAGMAGKTELLIGRWNNHFVHLPMSASAGKRKQVHPKEKLWLSVLGATGQGSLKND